MDPCTAIDKLKSLFPDNFLYPGLCTITSKLESLLSGSLLYFDRPYRRHSTICCHTMGDLIGHGSTWCGWAYVFISCHSFNLFNT